MKALIRFAIILGILWVCFVGTIYALMRRPPEQFAGAMARIQGPAFLLFPFETMWTSARAGALQIGDAAPNFRLTTLDKKSEVSLASFQGRKPVVLIFGSYT